MTLPQVLITLILVGALALFIHGRLRHDLVAFLALVACLLTGLVPAAEAFTGFSHPATITVAFVLVAGRALIASGAVNRLAHLLSPATGSVPSHVGSLSAVGAAMSAFMNNVGALALLMPIAVDTSQRVKRSPSIILMPLAFATILGGMVTLIGTPPNIIVSEFRAKADGEPFGMFDFAWVGLPIALVGVLFVALLGWRLIPRARRASAPPSELAATGAYLAELRVKEDSPWVDEVALEFASAASEQDITLVGLIRGERRYWRSATAMELRKGDVLLVEGAPDALTELAAKAGLELSPSADAHESLRSSEVGSSEMAVLEAVVLGGARAASRTARSLNIRRRFGVTLLGVSREGASRRTRLRDLKLRPGDLLLLHGDRVQLDEAVSWLGLLALEDRPLRKESNGRAIAALGLFVSAIVATAVGLAPLAASLAVAIAAMVLLGLLPLREVYESIDWPVIVLLASMIPVGGALESTGTTQLIADLIARNGSMLPAPLILGAMLVIAMTLSDLMSNAATAVVMAPIAASIAHSLGMSPDPFLMAVAIGASCAFLTPIGHQNNTLILGPGGYHFGDYWRMGLPLELLIVVLGIPLLLLAWPL